MAEVVMPARYLLRGDDAKVVAKANPYALSGGFDVAGAGGWSCGGLSAVAER